MALGLIAPLLLAMLTPAVEVAQLEVLTPLLVDRVVPVL
jgi:hypothetical protein